MSAFTGLPQIVLLIIPVPFFLLLLVIGSYHLTPLLCLLPNIHLVPLLHRLSTVIPSPNRNLPREFFNLPPRPTSPSTGILSQEDVRVLSVRGKVALVLTAYAILSLTCGWAFLASGGAFWPLAAMASTGVLSAVAILSVFTISRPSSSGWLVGKGGVTHDTVFPRILPISLVPVVLAATVSAAGADVGPKAILGIASLLVVVTLGCSIAGLRKARSPRAGIRLGSADAEEADESGTVEESWLSSFCKSNRSLVLHNLNHSTPFRGALLLVCLLCHALIQDAQEWLQASNHHLQRYAHFVAFQPDQHARYSSIMELGLHRFPPERYHPPTIALPYT